MKKTIIITILSIAGLIILIWWGGLKQEPQVKSTGEASVLSVDSNLHDFGSISMKDGNVIKDFIVTNSTDKDITVRSVLTSCMCTNALIVREDGTTNGPFGMEGMGHVPPANETIKAGENRIIRVIYDPNAHGPAGVGLIDRFVNLTDSSGNSLELEIKAIVTP
jgi:hypothetical protein